MLIIGRITKDAIVNTLKDERKVINFSIAVNDYYKPKRATETKRFTTFIHCSYWISSKLAERLKKGTLVELGGRIFVTAYLDTGGNPRASLNCHVNSIRVHSGAGKDVTMIGTPLATETPAEDSADDLPF